MSDESMTRAGIVAPTPPSDETGQPYIEMNLSILSNFHKEIHLFTRDTTDLEVNSPNVTVYKVSKPFAESSGPLRILGHLIYQLAFSLLLLRQRKKLDIVLFGGFGQLLPLITAKLIRANTVIQVAGVASYHYQSDASLRSKLLNQTLSAIQKLMCELTDVLAVTSPAIIQFADIHSYEEKIFNWQFQFYDLEQFSVNVPYSDREETVGHVGQLSDIKGSEEFARAMCEVSQMRGTAVKIVGDGRKRHVVERILRDCEVDAVFTGRVDRKNVPAELNTLRLLVLPSQTEGVPKIMIEAMACGTPVLATSVGGVPDYITDGETGFLLDNSDPDLIADRVVEILNRDDLNDISAAARTYIEDQVSYQSAVKDYRELLATMTPYDPKPIDDLSFNEVELNV